MRISPNFHAAIGLAVLLTLTGTLTSVLTAAASAQTTPAKTSPAATKRDLTPEQKALEAVTAPASDLKVTAWVDKTSEVYKPGDVLQLFVKTNQDAYLTVIDVGTSGRPLIIFPNKFQKDQRVLAHQVVQIPSPDADWRIKVSGPAGLEHIKVIVSTSPKPVINPSQLSELGPVHAYRGTMHTLTRDLSAELNERRTDSRAVYDQFVRILAESGAATPVIHPVASAAVSGLELFRLGEASFYGESGRSDHRVALKYFAAAADAGHVGAMYFVGRIHETGHDVDVDVAAALSWYRRAANLGNSQAMVRLAVLAGRAASGKTDRTETLQWLKKAAGQGDGMAMLHLAKMYDDGYGIERAPQEAARYLLAALKTGAWTVIDQLAMFSDATRRDVQGQLRIAGFYKGPTEGKIGAETKAALVDYARAGA
jgi:TPR repeat protein